MEGFGGDEVETWAIDGGRTTASHPSSVLKTTAIFRYIPVLLLFVI